MHSLHIPGAHHKRPGEDGIGKIDSRPGIELNRKINSGIDFDQQVYRPV